MNISLRHFTLDDYEAFRKTKLYSGTKTHWRNLIAYWNRCYRAGSSYKLAILSDDVIVGSITLYGILMPPHSSGQIGYSVAEDYRNRGIATESLKQCIEFAFDELNLKRLSATTLPENELSKHMLIKAGFEYEALVKNFYQGKDCNQYVLINPKADLAEKIAAS